jgi:hypothetical protein
MAKKKEILHGGSRKNSGRKPLPSADKKITLIIYPRQSEVDAVGGSDIAKTIALHAIQAKAAVLKKS